jgi:hypothetical protein
LQNLDVGDVVPNPEQVADSLVDVMDLSADPRANELAAFLGPFWSATKAREALRVGSRQAMESRRKSGALLGLRTSDGAIVYPVWQFRRSAGVVEVRPPLVPMLRTLKHYDPWTVGVLLRTPAPELETLTPLDWARAGRSPEALRVLACVVAREWSAGAA